MLIKLTDLEFQICKVFFILHKKTCKVVDFFITNTMKFDKYPQ